MPRAKKLKDLVYNVCLWDEQEQKIKTINIFNSSRVLLNAARYRTGDFDKVRNERIAYEKSVSRKTPTDYWHDWCMWVFGDCWSRYEWEFGFGDAFKKDDGSWNGTKTDVYTVFCKPNAALLKEMIDGVSVHSCKQYIHEWNETHGRYRRKNAS